jgi:hypothetical protein
MPGETNSPKRLEQVPVSTDVSIALGSALIASALVTPIILTIDKAVVQAAAGEAKLLSALVKGTGSFLRSPHKILLSFPSILVWSVYAATYTAANLLDIYNERNQQTG